MASLRIKRPSSARRHIKQESFSPYVSSGRLRRLQSLVASGRHGPDGILAIIDIDSRYNDGSLQLVNHLLFNFFDSRRKDIEGSGIAEEIVDDMMFLIKKNSVDVYCNPMNYHFLLPYIAHWRNLRIHCLEEEEYDNNEEKAEEFKIRSLMAMVDGCKTIGVPYYSTSQGCQDIFDIMAVEKWPIIQAFALDDFGGGGFFTMKYNVIDVSKEVHHIYQYMDPVSLELMVTEQLPLFEKHWFTMLSIIDVDKPKKGQNITENNVCEPLRSYYTHGKMAPAVQKTLSTRGPFVLFGQNTSREYLENMELNLNGNIMQTGVNGSPATHMIVQAVSPRSPVCCRRTYFFSHGVYPLPGSDDGVKHKNFANTDVRMLQLVYNGLVEAALKAIDTYCTTLSVKKSKEAAVHAIVNCCDKTRPKLKPKYLYHDDHFSFSLEAFDNYNCKVPLVDGEYCAFVKTVSLTVYDIPSYEHQGKIAGSVSFSHSFLDSSIRVRKPDGTMELEGASCVLTGHIPAHASWPFGQDHASVVHLEHELTSHKMQNELGGELIGGELGQLCIEDADSTVITDGQLYAFEDGIVYLHKHLAPVLLLRQDLADVKIYDGDSVSTVALLVLSYKPACVEFLPVYLRTHTQRLVLAFPPKSKIHTALYRQVLHVWKSVGTEVHNLDHLPPELEPIHRKLQATYKLQSESSRINTSHLDQAKMRLPDLPVFMSHFEYASVGADKAVASKHLSIVTGQPWDEGGFAQQKEMLVTLVTGSPGGGKDVLMTTLCSLCTQKSGWTVIKLPANSTDPFSPTALQASLKTSWTAFRRTFPSGGPNAMKLRVLVLVPDFTDTVDVVQAIMTHFDKDINSFIKISAVTACIDPSNVFMAHSFTFPTLLEQVAQGWVNNVVFRVTDASLKNEPLDRIQALIRAKNSNVALLLAPKGEVKRSNDLDLILAENSFNELELLRARYLSCPGWWLGEFDTAKPSVPNMENTVLTFSQPLDRERLLTRLKKLKKGLAAYPFNGNIYHLRGHIAFLDAPSDLFEFQYTVLSGKTSLVPSQPEPAANGDGAPQNFWVVFSGCQLQTEKLKDWLKNTAQPKPEKRVKRTRESLTKTEISRVHKQYHLAPLPEGWYYSGNMYVCMDGEKSNTHPCLENFLTEYLQQVNEDVDTYNTNIDAMNYKDLFE